MNANNLIALGGNLESPRNSKPSDYPAVGPSGPEGEAKGAGQLVSLTTEQEGPQHAQDEGEHTPAKWGKADWKVGTASEGSTSISVPYSVDFETGEHTC